MKLFCTSVLILFLSFVSFQADAQRNTAPLLGRVMLGNTPIANHQVEIRRITTDSGTFDSLNTSLYRNIVSTDSNGRFIDRVPYADPNLPTVYLVRTRNCDGLYIDRIVNVNANGADVPMFSLCGNPRPPCNMAFDIRIRTNGMAVDVEPLMIPALAPRYVYSFGDGTVDSGSNGQHTYAVPGLYNICVTAIAGQCQEVVCRTVVVGNAPLPDVIVGGKVFAGGRCVTQQVRVAFIPLDSALSPRRYMLDSNCSYRAVVRSGRYIIRAIPTDSALIADGYLPTFFGGHIRWDSVNIVELLQGRSDLDIQLIRRNTTRPLGLGQLRVRLDGHGTAVHSTTASVMYHRFNVEETPVFLYDARGVLLDYGMATATNPEFTFTGLTAGTYRTSPDAAFMRASEQWSTLATDASSQSINYRATINGIVAGVTALTTRGGVASLNVYPNPATTGVSLSVPDATGAAVVSLLSADGRVLFTKTVLDASLPTSLSVEGIAVGIYHVLVTQGGAKIGAARVQVVQ